MLTPEQREKWTKAAEWARTTVRTWPATDTDHIFTHLPAPLVVAIAAHLEALEARALAIPGWLVEVGLTPDAGTGQAINDFAAEAAAAGEEE